ncbi:hypothetical protein [Janthinobacterium sp. B9-8]|uniref:hypothetical protein n=1 Tax=Janthinobacterium sp. B9-8 TaxID=1236179 RepID=UPI00061D0EB7|nr:hypothetical protein [Janthinobacterium sp. B9-8]AMC35134.1 general stress protein CsbD [Janthinobacterium sp. B9-8]
MNKDQTKNHVEEAKGKEVSGKVVANKDLDQKGKTQNAEGKTKAANSDKKQKPKDASKDSKSK